jgi:GntR family transcriptional regulator
MHLHISASDGVPIYQQIVQQIKNLVASGRLAPGEELPPIRVLAEQLTVNANTVARAYRELGEAGILTNRRTAGTYVADGGLAVARQQGLEVLAMRVDALLTEAQEMNVSTDEVLALVKRRARANRPGSEEP